MKTKIDVKCGSDRLLLTAADKPRRLFLLIERMI